MPIIVVNKLDRPNARPFEVIDEVLELFMDLDATDEQLDSPVIYASGRDGYATINPEQKTDNMKPLFDMIVKFGAGTGGATATQAFRCSYQILIMMIISAELQSAESTAVQLRWAKTLQSAKRTARPKRACDKDIPVRGT